MLILMPKMKFFAVDSYFKKVSLHIGLGEIGPEDPNFKIKTCTLGF